MKVFHIAYTAVGIQILMAILMAVPCIGTEVVSRDKHLVLYDTGVVFDSRSGLEWYPGPDRSTSWEQAREWVDNLESSGGGWRMPGREELNTLYHLGDGVSNITPLLRNSGYWMWAGETAASSDRWVFSFSYGGEGWCGLAPPDGGRAIAVRNRIK